MILWKSKRRSAGYWRNRSCTRLAHKFCQSSFIGFSSNRINFELSKSSFPSLNKIDLNCLGNEKLVSMNRICNE